MAGQTLFAKIKTVGAAQADTVCGPVDSKATQGDGLVQKLYLPLFTSLGAYGDGQLAGTRTVQPEPDNQDDAKDAGKGAHGCYAIQI